MMRRFATALRTIRSCCPRDSFRDCGSMVFSTSRATRFTVYARADKSPANGISARSRFHPSGAAGRNIACKQALQLSESLPRESHGVARLNCSEGLRLVNLQFLGNPPLLLATADHVALFPPGRRLAVCEDHRIDDQAYQYQANGESGKAQPPPESDVARRGLRHRHTFQFRCTAPQLPTSPC